MAQTLLFYKVSGSTVCIVLWKASFALSLPYLEFVLHYSARLELVQPNLALVYRS